MELIKRENLMANLVKLEEERKSLEEKKYDYKVKRAWPGLCMIECITDVDYLIEAWNTIKDGTKSEDAAVNALGLSNLGLVNPSNEPRTYYGYPVEDWEEDLKTCATQLADVKKLSNIEQAISILRKNMSEEDKFNEDMNEVAKLLS